MMNNSLTLRLMEAKAMKNKRVYIAGPTPKKDLGNIMYLMTVANTLSHAGYRLLNAIPDRHLAWWYIIKSSAILIVDEWIDTTESRRAIKLAKMLRREVLILSEVEKSNAKNTNSRKERIDEFTDKCVANTKICFDKDDDRIASYIDITRRIGVEWKKETILCTEDNPLGVNREKERRFYVCKSERKDRLYGVKGGDQEYYNNSGEREITPEEFFTNAETIKWDLL